MAKPTKRSFKIRKGTDKGYIAKDDIKLSEETFNAAERRIVKALDDARKRLEKLEGIHTTNPSSHIYSPQLAKDYYGEVDVEWIINSIRGEDSLDTLSKMLESVLPMPKEGVEEAPILGEGYWIGVGIRWAPKNMSEEEKDEYEKDKGMIQITSNYRQMNNRSKILSAFNAMLEPSDKNPVPMVKLVEGKVKKKVAQIFVKVIWNPDNKQPKRFFKKKKKE